MVKLSKTKQAVRTQSIHCCFSTDNEGLGGQACAADQAPCHSPLVFHCYSGEGIYVWGGGEENNLNWAKTLYVNTIKVISGAKTRKICLHRITLYVSSYQGKGLTARKRQRREL